MRMWPPWRVEEPPADVSLPPPLPDPVETPSDELSRPTQPSEQWLEAHARRSDPDSDVF